MLFYVLFLFTIIFFKVGQMGVRFNKWCLMLIWYISLIAGSCLAVLPIDDCGRKSKTMPLLYAHTDTITDMDFSPFHDGLLATGSQDCLVSIAVIIWKCPLWCLLLDPFRGKFFSRFLFLCYVDMRILRLVPKPGSQYECTAGPNCIGLWPVEDRHC